MVGPLPAHVTDVRSNPDEQIAHAAGLISRSSHRRTVFKAIYRGKQKTKTVSQLMKATGFGRICVLKQGRALADNHIVKQIKVDGETAYEKDRFYAQKRGKILRLAENRRKLLEFPTKRNPRIKITRVGVETIHVSRRL